jgi:prolyl oligopeptidase
MKSTAAKLSLILGFPAVLLLSADSITAQPDPPAAPVRAVVDDYFGQRIVDPYRWMEDMSSPELQTWMHAQADHAEEYLARLPARDTIYKELSRSDQQTTAVTDMRVVGDLRYFTRRAPNDKDDKIWVHDKHGKEWCVADPTSLSTAGKRHSIVSWEVSRTGKYLYYLITAGGSERTELRVTETATGRDVGEKVNDVLIYGGWMPDEQTIVYTRGRRIEDHGKSVFARAVFLHILGTDPAADRPIFGYMVDGRTDIPRLAFPFAHTDPGSKYLLIEVSDLVSPTSAYYAVSYSDIGLGKVPWREVAGPEDEIVRSWYLNCVGFHGDEAYLISTKNAPRHKLVRIDMKDPEHQPVEVPIRSGDAVLEALVTSPDGLYLQTAKAGVSDLSRLDYATRRVHKVKAPYAGSVWLNLGGNTPRTTAPGIFAYLSPWGRGISFARSEPGRATLRDLHYIPPSPLDALQLEATTLRVRSYDGVMVPLVLLHKRGIKLDGKNPTILWTYGAYGLSSAIPGPEEEYVPWFARGGVLALAGVRGGGEYGEDWHMGGFQATKPNSWKDLIACAEFLDTKKYSSPSHLAIMSWSAGGIVVSNALAERPELFAAAVIKFGIIDTLRYETTPNGVNNISEFGSVKTLEGFKSSLAMDGYAKIKKGVDYPAVLLMIGMNDPRVAPWMSAKLAARLQAATSSRNPVLLRIDYDAGHAMGVSRDQSDHQAADAFAFLLERLTQPSH